MNQLVNNEEDITHKDFYRKAIDSYGVEDVRSLYWNSTQSQKARFLSLMRVGNFSKKKILDLGCGRADLLDYLISNKIIPTSYTGVDLMSEFIHFSQTKYPQYTFLQGNFFEINYKKKFDYIIANGSLNFKKDNNLQFIQQFIQFFLPFTKIAIGLTLLKEAKGYFTNPYIYSYQPKKVLKLVSSLNLEFKIFDDYSDNDMTIIINVGKK